MRRAAEFLRGPNAQRPALASRVNGVGSEGGFDRYERGHLKSAAQPEREAGPLSLWSGHYTRAARLTPIGSERPVEHFATMTA